MPGATWTAGAGVSPANVDQAIESIRREFALLGEEGVPDDELADSQAYLTGVVPLTLETNDGVANTLLNMEWHGLGAGLSASLPRPDLRGNGRRCATCGFASIFSPSVAQLSWPVQNTSVAA